MAEAPRLVDGLKPRPAEEVLNRLVFRPLGHGVVRLLWRTPLRPELLVLAHGLLGLLAAGMVAYGRDLSAALLLQLVTVLDNADGQLARARRQVSLLGRYLDSEVDLLVHAALFVALYLRTGDAFGAIFGFAALTLVLSLDYNLAALAAGEAGPDAAPRPGLEAVLARVYAAVFGWQDRAIRAAERALQRRLGAGDAAWWPRPFLAFFANLGRTTQFVILGLLLALGRPGAYLGFLQLTVLALLLVYAVRIWHAIRSPR